MRQGSKYISRFLFATACIFLCVVIIALLSFFLSYIRYGYPQNYFSHDDKAGFDISENFVSRIHSFADNQYEVWSNELGCFDIPYRGEDNYVMLVGDSFTWGYAPFSATYGNMIETYLKRRVLKCGVSGYGTKQEFIKIKKIIAKTKHKPKLIIVGYALNNDFLDDYLFPEYDVIDGYRVAKVKLENVTTGYRHIESEDVLNNRYRNYQLRTRLSTKINILVCSFVPYLKKISEQSRSSIYRLHAFIRGNILLRKTAKKIGLLDNSLSTFSFSTHGHPWVHEAWQKHLYNLLAIKNLASSYGANLLVIIIPSKEQVYDFLRAKSDIPERNWQEPGEIIRSFLSAQKISYIDLEPLFREYADQRPRESLDSNRDLYWRIDGHWNIKGNRLAGLLISAYILRHHMIDVNNAKAKQNIVANELLHSRD